MKHCWLRLKKLPKQLLAPLIFVSFGVTCVSLDSGRDYAGAPTLTRQPAQSDRPALIGRAGFLNSMTFREFFERWNETFKEDPLDADDFYFDDKEPFADELNVVFARLLEIRQSTFGPTDTRPHPSW